MRIQLTLRSGRIFEASGPAAHAMYKDIRRYFGASASPQDYINMASGGDADSALRAFEDMSTPSSVAVVAQVGEREFSVIPIAAIDAVDVFDVDVDDLR